MSVVVGAAVVWILPVAALNWPAEAELPVIARYGLTATGADLELSAEAGVLN